MELRGQLRRGPLLELPPSRDYLYGGGGSGGGGGAGVPKRGTPRIHWE